MDAQVNNEGARVAWDSKGQPSDTITTLSASTALSSRRRDLKQFWSKFGLDEMNLKIDQVGLRRD